MKVAVTGANGHVGANLCRELIIQGFEVKALIHNSDDGLAKLEIVRVKGNVGDIKSLENLCEGCEVVIHLAAMISVNGKKDLLQKVNVEGTRNILEVCRKLGIKRLIHFSSIHAITHFPLDQPMDESRSLVEFSPMMYEQTKATAEKMVLESAHSDLDVIIINPTAILGPNDFRPSLMGQVLIRLYKRTLPALVPGGYNWVDVRDITHAVINAISRGRAGERYILSGTWMSVRDLSILIEKVSNRKIIHFMIPTIIAEIAVPFMRIYAYIRGQHPLYTYESLKILREGNKHIINKKASQELDFHPRSLEDTIRDSIEWYRANSYIK